MFINDIVYSFVYVFFFKFPNLACLRVDFHRHVRM